MANPPPYSRRQFLQGALALGGVATAAGVSMQHLAHAVESSSDRYFVFCYFGGGWDVTLSLDPRDPDVYTNERRRELLTDAPYDSLTDTRTSFIKRPQPHPLSPDHLLGPYLGDRMKGWLEHAAIVRGLSMDTLGHVSGLRRFLTGKAPLGDLAKGSSIATHLAYQLGHSNPIPGIEARVESYNRDLPGWASALRLNTPAELVRILSPGAVTLGAAEEEEIDMVLGQIAECRASCLSDVRARALEAREDSSTLVRRSVDRLFRFDLAEMADLRTRYNFTTANGYNSVSSAGVGGLAALASQAVTNKVARVVTIRLAGGLDTHDQNLFSSQGPEQERGFDAIATMLEDFASRSYSDPAAFPYGGSDSWLNHVTIVAFSEFSRSSLLGSLGGRDHHLMNACLLAGADVAGGKVIGASADVGMMPQAVDFATGLPDLAGTVAPRPENVLRGMMASAGVTADVADLRTPPLAAAFRSLSAPV
jgi:uncharacterized protein (DUF1501 family)